VSHSLLEAILNHLELVDEEVEALCRRLTRVLIDRSSEVHTVPFDLHLELVSWPLKEVPNIRFHCLLRIFLVLIIVGEGEAGEHVGETAKVGRWGDLGELAFIVEYLKFEIKAVVDPAVFDLI
jgi:hypothetical protein